MPPKPSLFPNPQQMQTYKEVDERLPIMVIQAIDRDAQRDFWYAMAGMGTATVSFLSVVGSFVYLIMHGHPTAAGLLLAGGVLGIIQAMLRARLRSADKSKTR